MRRRRKGNSWNPRERQGAQSSARRKSLQETFGAAGRSVRLVVLDRCHSPLQAKALLLHVDCVVGTPGTAPAGLAEAYAIGFFGALGDGESAATAHRHGCAAVTLYIEGLPADERPGDDQRPRLDVRRGVDPGELILAR